MISHDLEELTSLAHEVAWVRPADTIGAPSRVDVVPANAVASAGAR